MTMFLNEKIIAISGVQLELFRQQLINEFQTKRITFNGDDTFVTTALNDLLAIASGKANIVVANILPDPTAPNTQYWVKTYDGVTKETGRFIVLTDALNNATLIGESEADLSSYVKQEQIQSSLLNDYYYRFKNGTQYYYTKSIANSADVAVYSITYTDGDVSAITLLPTAGELEDGILTYNGVEYEHNAIGDGYYVIDSTKKVVAVSALRGIVTSGGSGKVDDVTVDNTSVLDDKIAKFETPTDEEISALFDSEPVSPAGLVNIIYPVGSIIINRGTNPGTYLSGTTWTLYANDYKVLYAHSTAGTAVGEELPNIKGSFSMSGGSQGHPEVTSKSGAFTTTNPTSNLSYPQPVGSSGGARTVNFSAAKSNSVYKDNGKVRAEGITACYWVRIA